MCTLTACIIHHRHSPPLAHHKIFVEEPFEFGNPVLDGLSTPVHLSQLLGKKTNKLSLLTRHHICITHWPSPSFQCFLALRHASAGPPISQLAVVVSPADIGRFIAAEFSNG